mgnify:FL=1
MWYIIFIVLTFLIYSFRPEAGAIRIKRNQLFWIASFPFIILWTLFIGGQDNVGADYPTYLYIFEGHMADGFATNEWIFSNFIIICNHLGFYGQSVFFIIAFITCIFLLTFCKKIISLEYMPLFLFLFITIPGTFNNQMNGIRQYIAVYIMSVCYLTYCEKKYLISAILLFIAMHIHNTALFAAVIYIAMNFFIKRYENKWDNKKILYIVIIASIVICFTFDAVPFIQEYLKYIPFYSDSYWLHQEFFSNNNANKLRKVIDAPFYFYCVYLLDKIKLEQHQRFLYIAGILAFCIKICFLGVIFINRMGQYFELLMCIPIFFAIIHMKRTHNDFKYLWIAFFFLYYFIKVVVFPVGEYSYSSVFF